MHRLLNSYGSSTHFGMARIRHYFSFIDELKSKELQGQQFYKKTNLLPNK